MTTNRNNQNDTMLLAWAANKIRKAQDDDAYCTIVVHVKNGEIVKTERNEAYLPPAPGRLVKNTDG